MVALPGASATGLPHQAGLFCIWPFHPDGDGGGREQTVIVFSLWHRPPIRESAAVSGLASQGVATAQRSPMLLFLLSGLFLLRLAERTLFRLLFHEPPRSPSSLSPQNAG
jgi:hypothetical protein